MLATAPLEAATRPVTCDSWGHWLGQATSVPQRCLRLPNMDVALESSEGTGKPAEGVGTWDLGGLSLSLLPPSARARMKCVRCPVGRTCRAA